MQTATAARSSIPFIRECPRIVYTPTVGGRQITPRPSSNATFSLGAHCPCPPRIMNVWPCARWQIAAAKTQEAAVEKPPPCIVSLAQPGAAGSLPGSHRQNGKPRHHQDAYDNDHNVKRFHTRLPFCPGSASQGRNPENPCNSHKPTISVSARAWIARPIFRRLRTFPAEFSYMYCSRRNRLPIRRYFAAFLVSAGVAATASKRLAAACQSMIFQKLFTYSSRRFLYCR